MYTPSHMSAYQADKILIENARGSWYLLGRSRTSLVQIFLLHKLNHLGIQTFNQETFKKCEQSNVKLKKVDRISRNDNGSQESGLFYG